MVDICPVHDKAWKNLVEIAGSEKEAMRLYIASGNTIPTTEELVQAGLIDPKREKPKFQPIIDNLEQQRRIVYQNIAKLEDKLRTDKENKRDILDRIKAARNKIEVINDKIDKLSKEVVIEDSLGYAQEDLDYVTGVLSKPNISFSDLQDVDRIIKLWVKAGELSTDHIFFTDSEIAELLDENNEGMYKLGTRLSEVHRQFVKLRDKRYRIATTLLEQQVKETLGRRAGEIDITAPMQDVSKLFSLAMGLSHVDNVVTQAMVKWVRKALYESHLEAREIIDGLGDVFTDLRKSGYKIGEVQDLFAQRFGNDDDRRTGNLVYRYTQAYFDEIEKIGAERKAVVDRMRDEADQSIRTFSISQAYKKYGEDMRSISMMFDARKLFPDKEFYTKQFSDSEIEEHRKELISNLGQKGYEFYLDVLQRRLDTFRESRKEQLEWINENVEEDMRDIELKRWEYRNSPYYAAESYYNGTPLRVGNEFITPSGFMRRNTIPRRRSGNKDNGFYDSNFERIESDPKLLALHTYLVETIQHLNSFLPEDIRDELHINTLPFLEKTVLEQFSEQKLRHGFSPIHDVWKKSITSKVSSIYEPTGITDVEGEVERRLRVDYIPNMDKVINDYIKRKTIEYRLDSGKEPSLEMMQEWRRKIVSSVSESRSFDLEKLFKAYTMSVLGFKHKSKIEDAMNVAYSILSNKIEEQQTNNTGDVRMNQFKEAKTKKGLASLKQMIDGFMEHWYGEPTRKDEVVIKGKKRYTRQELETKKELERLKEENSAALAEGSITRKEFINNDRELDAQLNTLGGVLVGSKIGDNMNMWVRLRGLGWNMFAPIMNSGIGYITNLIEAAGNENFNSKELHQAYYEILHNGKKVRSLMERFDTLKEIQNEIYQTKRMKNRRNWLAPFWMQNRSEYLNQSPVLVAMMKRAKVKMENGTEVSMWDAYDDNGEVKKGFPVSRDAEVDMKIDVDRVVMHIHGNYDYNEPILANKSILGRSLLVFRKWMINSYFNRLGNSKYSSIAGRTEKGRWLTYGNYVRAYGPFGALLDTIVNLARKMTFGAVSTKFEKLNDVDAANMRRNLSEIMTIIAMTGLGLLLKAAVKVDDDDDRDWKYLAFYWINLLNRLEMDLRFYLDPEQFKTILRDPIPMMGLVGDIQKAVTRSVTLITGGEDEYQSGIHKGESKAWVATKDLFPLTNTGNRFKTLTQQVIQK